MEALKYPIGKFNLKEEYSAEELKEFLSRIEKYPDQFKTLVSRLDPEELGKTYREGGWNIAQIIHHLADTHVLHYFRMKKSLTEKDYTNATMIEIDAWAQLPDANFHSVKDSLEILSGIHTRFVQMARALSSEQWEISYYHPMRKSQFNQKQAVALVAWHCEHHFEHIQFALKN